MPDLDLAHLGGPGFAHADLHYEALGTIASQLGRSMALHQHHDFFQVHYVLEGPVRVQLEDRLYRLDGPMVFMTPPAFLHAFVTEDDADGHVLTVRKQCIWPMLGQDAALAGEAAALLPMCLGLAGLHGEIADEAARMDALFGQLRVEFKGQRPGRGQGLLLLSQLIFISLLRLMHQAVDVPTASREELPLFQRFSSLLESHFHAHWAIPRYATELGVTERRLNDACRQLAGKTPKQLIDERLIQEARRLLLYTQEPVSQIAYVLGFDDPAYFSRFFQRHAKLTPSQCRVQMAEDVRFWPSP
ncbi:4-hydroxyphenylacetate catabolism regulatory protein HpaA [Castellaniella caeni]|uniref:4-hydroxyphenylacetate catabolism regulatory protein HpaA n=1 Tax=Castellaniella caeni TaxID=266123 RepID=UPI000A45C75F|nr:4-hydroxyphenylacetate catabolism regulatory protein HpaA [Castellaniella caeni]